MRAAFYRPGTAEPYLILYRPVTMPPDGLPVLLGGELTILRGGFPDRGRLLVSAPITFQAKDWVRVWLDGDLPDDPTYTGEALGEPWPLGQGEVELAGLWNSLARSRWAGQAEGDFEAFFSGVLAKSDVPAWLPVAPLPAISSLFSADVPFELLGDTVSAITPALDGHLIGVTAKPEIACVDPGLSITHRFNQFQSERPAGSTENYVNCVRFSYEYPSGDTGYFEGINEQEVTAKNGLRVWTTEQVTAREIGEAQQPYGQVPGDLTVTLRPGGLVEFQVDSTVSGLPLHDLSLQDAVFPVLQHAPNGTYPGSSSNPAFTAAREGVDHELAAQLIFPTNSFDVVVGEIKKDNPMYSGASTLATSARFEVVLNLTARTNIPPENAIWFGIPDANGVVTWRAYGDPYFVEQAAWAGGWNAVAGEVDTYRFLLPTVFVTSQLGNKPLHIAYRAAYRDACLAAGLEMKPITFRGGGLLHKPLEPPGGIGSLSYVAVPLQDTLDGSVIRPVVRAGSALASRVNLPFPLFSSKFSAAHDPVLALGARNEVGQDILVDLDTPVNLPFGSSVEVELLTQDSALSSVVAMPDASGQQQAVQRAAEGKMGFPSALAEVVLNATPSLATVLARQDAVKGWAIFAVRGPAGWNGEGVPPDLLVRRFIMRGVVKVGRVRIRTPQLDGLTAYGARLLRYRSQPMRDWRGVYEMLSRQPALGVAAFEVPGQADDDLLDVQRVTYDLTNLRVTVQAGSPLPVDDVDAVDVAVDRLQRVMRRAGSGS